MIFLLVYFLIKVGFSGDSDCKEFAFSLGDPNSIPGSEGPMEKEMATNLHHFYYIMSFSN